MKRRTNRLRTWAIKLAPAMAVAFALLLFPSSAYALNQDQRMAVVDAARGEVGTSFAMDVHADYYITEDCKYGGWFAGTSWWNYFKSNYYLHEAPWCVMFLGYCAEKAGIGADDIPRLAAVGPMVDWYNERGRYHPLGTYRPQPGDIAFFAGGDGWTHAAFVTEYSEGDSHSQAGTYHIRIIEGDVVVGDDQHKQCAVQENVREGQLPQYALTCSTEKDIVGFGEN